MEDMTSLSTVRTRRMRRGHGWEQTEKLAPVTDAELTRWTIARISRTKCTIATMTVVWQVQERQASAVSRREIWRGCGWNDMEAPSAPSTRAEGPRRVLTDHTLLSPTIIHFSCFVQCRPLLIKTHDRQNFEMGESESVVLETSMGDIQLELYWEHAPRLGRDYLALHRTDPLIDYRAHQTCKNFEIGRAHV